MHDAGSKPMTIGQVAKLAGVGVETIRFYEREGLLNKPKRKESGYRMFENEAVTRIRFIKNVKELGFSLKEIRELLFLRVDSRATATEVKKRVDSKIEQIDRRINDLKRVRNALAQLSRSVGKGPINEFSLLDVLEKSKT
jgi:DNA-binding transcriptional MerR regulator